MINYTRITIQLKKNWRIRIRRKISSLSDYQAVGELEVAVDQLTVS